MSPNVAFRFAKLRPIAKRTAMLMIFSGTTHQCKLIGAVTRAKQLRVERWLDIDDSGGLWAKLFQFFSLNKDEFLTRYHQRSKAESTFSMVKAK